MTGPPPIQEATVGDTFAGDALTRPAAPAPGDPDPMRAVAQRLGEALVPRFADIVAVHLREEQPGEPDARVTLRRIGARGSGAMPGCEKLLPAGEIVRWPRNGPVVSSLSRAESVHIPFLDDTTANHLADQLAVAGLAGSARGASVLLLPLAVDGKLLGNVLLICGPGRMAIRESAVPVFEVLATWAAGQIRAAGHRGGDSVLAAELRHAVRPRLPRTFAGVEVAFRSRPRHEHELGGDWFDVFNLPRGRTAFVIGDVKGHGPQASVMMSQCRAMVRALAAGDPAPDTLLARLDSLVHRMGEEHGPQGELLVTCTYVVYDPAIEECQVATAGHVPLVAVHPSGRPEVIRPPAGAPLGVGGVEFRTADFAAPDGTLLALYTDGLLDGVDVEQGIRALADLVAELVDDPDLDEGCGQVLTVLCPAAARDDVTLLLTRLTAQAPDEPVAGPAAEAEPAEEPEWQPPEPQPVIADEDGFVGRVRELAELHRLLLAARLVTVTGPAGVGKSRLVRQVAGLLRADYPDAVRLVDLAGVTDHEQIPVRVSTVVGSLLDFESRDLILILDGCEHLADACSSYARSLLRAAPRVRVLTTSRRALAVTGEHIQDLGPLSRSEAMALFTDRARRRLSAADRSALPGLLQRLDRLPLAIELAADERGSLAELADAPDLVARLGPLHAAIGQSHTLCDPLERLLWARLSIFEGPFDLAEAERVCADERLPASGLLPLLSGLVRQSIVGWDRAAAAYRLPETYRAFGREHLERLGEVSELRGRMGTMGR